ncbi:MotA/TolQ/ExbB proton channel family protein [Imperialibacter roseus]|uniref:MotA/TolQ/ExbB proton channel family protein n=1 Tax=Imperialibacter roseus TaxID=1324217 RepID=A0ABZ0IIG3_9BACT|nr:MotA/TolQ/ExbB proton channel family protein [Imperialibacter roseus]WOK04813.1 MotA/TolQ/ExbB proton channel family protein [Imperialibacter roseus]
MIKFFYTGGNFMSILTIELVIITAWIIYQLVTGYNSKQPNKEEILRKISYGKSMGFFALATGFLGQMFGLMGAFSVIKQHPDIKIEYIFDGVGVSMISATYGVFIFLFSMILWFVASMVIEKKFKTTAV